MLNLCIPNSHPQSISNIKVKAMLLDSSNTMIYFRYSDIDWQSHECEPYGILINNYYPPSQESIYGRAALVAYKSMEIVA